MAKEILIADGDKADQKEFKKIFEPTDYNLVFSDSGEQALLRLKLFKPNLIIIGSSLKEKNGLEVFKAIKTNPESKHIPVVLLSNILGWISEDDPERIRADGIITIPFQEDETLNLVDRLMEEGKIKEKGEGIIGRAMEWESIADNERMNSEKREESLSEPVEEAEDEVIIDLVDVVEEPERKMSIQDFVGTEKEAPLTEITPLESWEKLMEEEKPADKRSKFGPDEKEREAKGLSLKFSEDVHFDKEVQDKESLEKMELEEILQKVEQMAPSIEKEWPPEARQRVPEKQGRAPEKAAPAIEEPPEKYAGLAEFEAALRKGLGERPPGDEAPPSYVEKPTEAPKAETKEEIKVEKNERPIMEARKEAPSVEISLEEQIEEVLKKLPQEVLEEELEVVKEEEFSELVLEKAGEKDVGAIEKPPEEKEGVFESLEFPEVEKEEIGIIEEPEEEGIGLFEEIEAPEVVREEARVIGKPREEREGVFESLGFPEVEKEEIGIIEEPEEEEEAEILEEAKVPETVDEEVRAFEKGLEERLELFIEMEAPKVGDREVAVPEVKTPGVTVPVVQGEEIISPSRSVEIEMEEVISKGARELIEGFITKLVPEMTQNLMNLTIERIERMVKEIVPGIAEKMIQEEIKRLQGEEEED